MKDGKTYQLMVAKMREVSLVPPQTIGPFTGVYKRIVPFFKFSPWRSAALISFFTTVILYFMLGSTLVKIASILQFGF
ncbi:hypothetical protein HY029_05635 [Candidatus Gottesmanbacteria bacterium]|nr:hypothetical protein [Candidatus Gottesmanbacteria bacterium]